MFRNAIVIAVLFLAIGSTGIVSAQYGSTMYADESDPISTPYEPGDKVSVDVVLNMNNVDRYDSKLEFDDKYLDFHSITKSEKHDGYADPGSSGTVYVGGQADNSSMSSEGIDNPKLIITFEVKEDIPKDGSVRSNISVEDPSAVINGDRVTDIISQGTVIDIDSGERAFELGIEMSGDKEIQRGESLTVDAYANSNLGKEYQELDLQLLVDENRDGFFGNDEIVEEKTVDMEGSQDSFRIEYEDVDLSGGEYKFQSRLVKGGNIERSYTNSTLRVYDKTQNVDVSIYEKGVEVGEKVEVPIYVEGDDIAEYVLSIKYNDKNMDFVSVEGQSFSQPSVNSQDGYVTLSAKDIGNYENSTAADLIFEGEQDGYSNIEILGTDSSFTGISGSEINANYTARGVEVSAKQERENESDKDQDNAYLDVTLQTSDSTDEGRVDFKTAVESSSQIETIVFDAKDNQRQSKIVEYDGYGTVEFSHKYEESGSYVPKVEVTTVSGETITDEKQVEVDIEQSYTGENKTDDPLDSEEPPLNDSEDEGNETDVPSEPEEPPLNDSEDEGNETDVPSEPEEPPLNESEDEGNETDAPSEPEEPPLNESEDEGNETDVPSEPKEPPLNESEDEGNGTDDPFGSGQPPINESEGSENVSGESQGIIESFVSAIGFGNEPQTEDTRQNNESSDTNKSSSGEQDRDNGSDGIIEIFSSILG